MTSLNKLAPLSVLVANLFVMGAAVAAPPPVQAPGNKPVIDSMVTIPTTKIRAIKDGSGQIIFLADNGRLAIIGQMYDVKNKRTLRSIEDFAHSLGIDMAEDRAAQQVSSRVEVLQEEIARIEKTRGVRPSPKQAIETPRAKPAPAPEAGPEESASDRIDLAAKGFDLGQTNHISIGNGGKHVTIFVDPRCGWCHKLLEEIKGDASYMEKYTFDIVILHVLGDESAALAKKLHCAKTDDQTAKFNALVAGKSAIDKLEQQDKCDIKQLRSTVVQQHALQINSVPFIITSDKRFVRGKPQDVRGFLDDELAKKQADEARAKRQEEIKKALDAVQGRESKPAANDASKGADNAGSTKVTPKTK